MWAAERLRQSGFDVVLAAGKDIDNTPWPAWRFILHFVIGPIETRI
jgi:hypothetical protein